MNSNSSKTKLKLLWPGIALMALILWTILAHVLWLNRQGIIHGVPGFFLGLLILNLGVGTVFLFRGARQRGRRWLVSREALRIITWTAAFAISTVILFYAVELWRGHRAWASAVQEAKTRDETLSYEGKRPSSVPDDQNFAKAPIFAPIFARKPAPPLFDYRRQEKYLIFTERLKLPYDNWYTKEMPWFDQEKISPRAWAEYYEGKKLPDLDETQAAKIVLAAFTRYAATLAQVREYSTRPFCRFPIGDENPELMPPYHLVTFRDLIHLLGQRASAELILRQSQAAFEDAQLCLRLVDYYRQQASAMAGRDNPIEAALQPVWEGLGSHQWTELQLAELQNRLQGLDLFVDYRMQLRADALDMASFVEAVIPTGHASKPIGVGGNLTEQRTLRMVRWIYPEGWSLQDQAAIHRYHFRCADNLLDWARRRDSRNSQALFTSSDPFFPIYVTPKVLHLAQANGHSFLLTQTAVNQALLGCALERYRLARGVYPEKLESLAPDFIATLPQDVVTGEPLNYRRLGEDRFVLYSVGFNKADDRGKPSPREKDWKGIPRPRPDLNKGDWVWTYSQKLTQP